jgi:hypothetical protein
MPLHFDYDPVNQTHQYFDYDPLTGDVSITTTQDVSETLDVLKTKRDDPEAWKKGVKECFAHYASIPVIVEMELKKKGISIYDKNCSKRLIQEIEQNYPYLKVTDKKMWRPV